MPKELDLINDPIPKLTRSIAIPASVGYLFHTMFNVVDTYYAGLISTQALAALSLAFPVFFIITASGGGVATGATALIATALGKGDRKKAEELAAQAIAMGLILAVLLSGVGIWFLPFFFGLLGAKGPYLRVCMDYMTPIYLGALFFIMVYMFNALLNAKGNTKPHRNFLIAGFFLNLALDPWFIFGGFGLPAMGVAGLSTATVFIMFLGDIYLGVKAFKSGIITWQGFKPFIPRPKILLEITRQGFPAALNYLTISLGSFVITYFFSLYGEQAVAAYGIGTRVEQIMLMPTMGLNTATLALVAQNHGACRFSRIPESMKTGYLYGGLVMGLGTIAAFVFARRFMELFTGDARVIAIGVDYLEVVAFLLYSYVVLFVSVGAMQGVKRPMFALGLGVTRQFLLPIPVLWLFSGWMGVKGIWWGVFAINWAAAAFAFFYSRWRIGKDLAPENQVDFNCRH